MKKRGFIKRIKKKIVEFFEEDPENEEEDINLKTLIITFFIGFIIIISIYLYTSEDFGFMKFDFDETEDMEQGDNREIIQFEDIQFEDYFMERKDLKNSDFSEGMNHWSTPDGGESSKDSISKRTLNKEDYHSYPQSLQIDCSQPPCRVYYDTKSHSIILDYPYNIESETWMGVKPGTKFKIKYWYKGSKYMFYILDLDKNGNFENLETIENEGSTEWVKNEFITVIPKDKIAIGIEIAMDSKGTLLLDDIQLERIE